MPEKAFTAATEDALLGLPEDAAHSHRCEEEVSFVSFAPIFLTLVRPESDGWRERERERETQTSRGEEILGFVSIKQHFCVVTLDDIRGGRQQRTAFADLTKHFQTHIRICSTWQELRLSSLTPWELQWRRTPMVKMTYLAWKSIREVWI